MDEYSEKDQDRLNSIETEINYLSRMRTRPVSATGISPSDVEGVDYELGIPGFDYYVNALRNGASYRIAVSDENLNWVDEEGTLLDNPYVDAVVPVGDMDNLYAVMVETAKDFKLRYIDSKIYSLEEERSYIESKYDDGVYGEEDW